MAFVSPPIDVTYDHLILRPGFDLDNCTATVSGPHSLDITPATGYTGWLKIFLRLLTATDLVVDHVILKMRSENGVLQDAGAVVIPTPIVKVDARGTEVVCTLVNVSSLKENIADWSIRVDGGFSGDSSADLAFIWSDPSQPLTVDAEHIAEGVIPYGNSEYSPAEYVNGSIWTFSLSYHPGEPASINLADTSTPQIDVGAFRKVNGSPLVYAVATTQQGQPLKTRVFGLEALTDAYPKFQWRFDDARQGSPAALSTFSRQFIAPADVLTGSHTVTLLGVASDGSVTELGSASYDLG